MTYNEYTVLSFLSKNQEGIKKPQNMTAYEYRKICRSLEELDYISIYDTKDGTYIDVEEEGLDALEYFGKIYEGDYTELQFELLKLLVSIKPKDKIEDIQIYEPFNAYTLEELYDEFLPLREIELIKFFGDDPRNKFNEKPSWFMINDEGRIVYRRCLEKRGIKISGYNPFIITPETKQDSLFQDLIPVFEDENDIPIFINFIKKASKPTEITKKVSEMVGAKRIKVTHCKGILFELLVKHGLYKRSLATWNKQVLSEQVY